MPARVSQRDTQRVGENQEGTKMECPPRSEFAVNEDEVEKEVWRCLNSVHLLLRRREILDITLRQERGEIQRWALELDSQNGLQEVWKGDWEMKFFNGEVHLMEPDCDLMHNTRWCTDSLPELLGWMELVSARYEMGPARISHPLFSLKPQAAKAVIDTSPRAGDDKFVEEMSIKGPVIFDLIKDTSERTQKVAADARKNYSNYSKKNPSSQLRRRPVSILADDEKDGLLDYSHLIDDSDSEDDLKPLKIQKDSLQGFGAIVSPRLRSAQGTFFKALQLAVELLNAQNEAMDAHNQMSSLQASTGTSVVH